MKTSQVTPLTFGFVMLLVNSMVSPVVAHPYSREEVIALGEIARPNLPGVTGQGTSLPTTGSSPAIGGNNLFPPSKEPPRSQAEAEGQPAVDLSKPLNMMTIEYNEGLEPPSNLPGLSVVQALNQALVNGPRAAAVRAQLAIARANYPAATVQPNPIFFMDRGLVAEQVNRMGPVLTLDPPWKLLFRLLAAKRLVAQTKIDLLTTIWSLRADARRAYVELVVAQETQKSLVQLFELASRLLVISDKRFRAGDVPELDVLKARLAASQAEADVRVGNKRVQKAKQILNILMGKPSDSQLYIAPLPEYTGDESRTKLRAQKSDILPDYDREVPPLKDFIEKALKYRLELISLILQLKVNKANLTNAVGNIVADPSFAFGKSTAGNPTPGPKVTAVFMTLYAEFPFSNYNQGQIYTYKAAGTQLHYQIESQKNQVIADVSSAYNNLIAARKKIHVYQERLLTDSNEVARLARRSYEVGQSDITSTLQAQQANVQVRNSYLDAINSYGSAFTDLELAIGKPLQ
jgi:outer membrane protein, heavy metal efflux system